MASWKQIGKILSSFNCSKGEFIKRNYPRAYKLYKLDELMEVKE